MRTLVIGCGSIGARHARNARAFGAVELFDPVEERAAFLGAEIGATARARLEDALAAGPDAVIVAAPNDAHIALARRCLPLGAPILIEKPIADAPAGVDAFLRQAEAAGAPILVGCNMRFHPGPATLRAALGSIGRPHFLRAQYGNWLPNQRPGRDYRELYCAQRRLGGGVVRDSIHEIDLSLWLLGPVAGVSCETGKLSDLEIDVEDYAALSLRHASGARSEIHLDYLQRAKRRGCEIVGSEGTLIWASEGKAPEQVEVRRFLESEGRWEILRRDEDLDPDLPFRAMLEAFLSGDHAPLQDGWGGLRALEICLEALAHGERAETAA